jgi:predicted DNA binding CopG/RHH family protein
MEEGAKSRLDLKDAKNRALRRGINYQDKIRLSAVDAW